MDNLFHIIDDAQVILKSKGVFHQKKVYRRGNRLFAAWGSGYVRLGGGDATSCPGVSYETLDLPSHVQRFVTKIGQLGEPLYTDPERPELAVVGKAA